MTYEEDVALVLGAMGTTPPRVLTWNDGWKDQIDANLIVERVIPWAEREKRLVPVIEGRDLLFDCLWCDYATGTELGCVVQKATMPEAVITALANALRSTT